MGRKKSWFNLVKRFFIADRVLKPDKVCSFSLCRLQ
uniref:Uncharacterized protein n=1 Tax=Rhizophora mucronata TaxID=61149 RepID=A0A2P2K7J6_RHIMU